MSQPKDLKKGLECCADPECVCDDVCPYASIKFPKCREQLLIDAATLVKQVPRWISVKERLPEEGGKYIVCTVKGRVYCTHFRLLGSSGVFQTDINTHIAYWMPMPEGPKEGE